MDAKKINRIIDFIREEMMTANPPGGQGGFGADSPAKGPRAGFDPVMGKMEKRKRPRYIWTKGIRKNWKKKEDN